VPEELPPSVTLKTLGKEKTLGKLASLPSVKKTLGRFGKEVSLPSVFLYSAKKKIPSPDLQIFSTLHIQYVVLHFKIW
jgi:hypothetical protein